MDNLNLEEFGWNLAERWHKNHTIAVQMARIGGLTNAQYCHLLNAGVLRTDTEVAELDAKERGE